MIFILSLSEICKFIQKFTAFWLSLIENLQLVATWWFSLSENLELFGFPHLKICNLLSLLIRKFGTFCPSLSENLEPDGPPYRAGARPFQGLPVFGGGAKSVFSCLFRPLFGLAKGSLEAFNWHYAPALGFIMPFCVSALVGTIGGLAGFVWFDIVVPIFETVV